MSIGGWGGGGECSQNPLKCLTPTRNVHVGNEMSMLTKNVYLGGEMSMGKQISRRQNVYIYQGLNVYMNISPPMNLVISARG